MLIKQCEKSFLIMMVSYGVIDKTCSTSGF